MSIFYTQLRGFLLCCDCAKRNYVPSEIAGAVAHEESGEFAISPRCCGTVRNGNDPTVSFGADQMLKIVTVDGDNNPPLLSGEGIDFLVRDAGFMVVVSDMLGVEMGI